LRELLISPFCLPGLDPGSRIDQYERGLLIYFLRPKSNKKPWGSRLAKAPIAIKLSLAGALSVSPQTLGGFKTIVKLEINNNIKY